MKRMNRFFFYFLSFTWGLPLTLFGCLIASFLLLSGHKAQKFALCYCFELGHDWGGLELGFIFLVCRDGGVALREHEFGHAIQNCIFGPLMPLLVSIPSSFRYWVRRLVCKKGRCPSRPYDAVWFESQANRFGHRMHQALLPNEYNNERKW